jgi:GT2 family glycosyltransferase
VQTFNTEKLVVAAGVDVSIIILNYNDKEYLKGCLQSLDCCSKSRHVEIIVSDNASTDGSIEMVESEFPHVRLLKNNENLGFTKGNNVGIRASTGRYVFLLNSDIKILDGCIDAMAQFLDDHPDVGIAGPRVLNRDMTHQSTCRRYPTLWSNFCQLTGLSKSFRGSRFFSGEHMFFFKGDREADVEVLVGCFSALRRKAIDQVGMLDENFYMYGDDLDWCRRLREGGWRVVFHPGGQAIHYIGTSTTKKDPVRYALLQQQSVIRYWRKYHGRAAVAGIQGLMSMRLTVRWAIGLFKFLAIPAKRDAGRIRMRESSTCLAALFGDISGNGRTASAGSVLATSPRQ